MNRCAKQLTNMTSTQAWDPLRMLSAYANAIQVVVQTCWFIIKCPVVTQADGLICTNYSPLCCNMKTAPVRHKLNVNHTSNTHPHYSFFSLFTHTPVQHACPPFHGLVMFMHKQKASSRRRKTAKSARQLERRCCLLPCADAPTQPQKSTVSGLCLRNTAGVSQPLLRSQSNTSLSTCLK